MEEEKGISKPIVLFTMYTGMIFYLPIDELRFEPLPQMFC